MQISLGAKQHKYLEVMTGAMLACSLFTVAATPSYGQTTTVHSASAYGAEVKVGTAVKVGPVAVAELPACSTQPIASFTASAASVTGGLLSTGAVSSVASSTATTSTGSSEVTNVSLLGGLIGTTDIKAVSTSSLTGGAPLSSAAGSTFANLTVLGLPIAANVAPNTKIDLPGIGSVTLNEQETSTSSVDSKLVVNMIDVKITLGANKGTEIIVAHAESEIKSATAPAVVGGIAYAPKLELGPVTSGPLVLEEIGCFGTNGVVETDSVADVSFPGVLSTGTVTATGEGYVSHSHATSQATTSIAGANVLSGLVGATAIMGTASATTTDGVTFNFTGGATFVDLTVAGHPEITDNPAPNTKIKIANLGTLYFNLVDIESDKIKVTPIELIVNTTNSLGLPIGAELTLGVAQAELHSTGIE